MQSTSVTSKGQVTIPKEVRQKMGIRAGSKIDFVVVNDHIEMRVSSRPVDAGDGGFGMLKSKRPALPADLDPASLIPK